MGLAADLSEDFNRHNPDRDAYQLHGPFARRGYDWWWHSFTAHDAETGMARPFFIEFFCINPAQGGSEPVLGQLPANKAAGRDPSYLMIKCGAWGDDAGHKPVQLHRFFGWDDVSVTEGAPYAVDAGDCHASETALSGSVEVTPEACAAHPEWMCGAGSMRWSLAFDKQVAFNVGYGASTPLRNLEAFAMYWHAEGMRTAYSGTIELDGRSYVVDPKTCFGYADKNWGSDFTSPWVWLASSNLTSRITGRHLGDTCFDIGGGDPKAFGIEMRRQLLAGLWYEGEPYEFNFSKPWTGCKTTFFAREESDRIVWHVEQETRRARMVTDASCEKAHMLLVNYEAPDGARRHTRLWNGGDGTGRVRLYARDAAKGGWKLVDDMDAANIGCEYGEYDAHEPYGTAADR